MYTNILLVYTRMNDPRASTAYNTRKRMKSRSLRVTMIELFLVESVWASQIKIKCIYLSYAQGIEVVVFSRVNPLGIVGEKRIKEKKSL